MLNLENRETGKSLCELVTVNGFSSANITSNLRNRYNFGEGVGRTAMSQETCLGELGYSQVTSY